MHPWILLPEQSLQQIWSCYPSPRLNEPMNSLYLWVHRKWEALGDMSQDYFLSIISLRLLPNDEHFPQRTTFLSTQCNFRDSAQVSTTWNLFLWHLPPRKVETDVHLLKSHLCTITALSHSNLGLVTYILQQTMTSAKADCILHVSNQSLWDTGTLPSMELEIRA